MFSEIDYDDDLTQRLYMTFVMHYFDLIINNNAFDDKRKKVWPH